MEKVTFLGTEVHTQGNMPEIGIQAPDFTVVKGDLTEIKLSDFRGKKVILNILPSLDTPVCAMSVRKFNEAAASLDNTVILTISMDLPFAQERFCTTEGIKNVIPVSLFRSHDFPASYGLILADGPLAGLTARAVLLIDEKGMVVYKELVQEITTEPDYSKVLDILKD